MRTYIHKMGDDLAVSIPMQYAKQLDFQEGSEIEIDIVDGKLVIQKIYSKEKMLNALLDEITPDNCHSIILDDF